MKNEAKSASIDHVNVVRLHAVIFEPKHYGLVMEFVPTGCLEEFIGRNKVLFDNLIKCILTFIFWFNRLTF